MHIISSILVMTQSFSILIMALISRILVMALISSILQMTHMPPILMMTTPICSVQQREADPSGAMDSGEGTHLCPCTRWALALWHT